MGFYKTSEIGINHIVGDGLDDLIRCLNTALQDERVKMITGRKFLRNKGFIKIYYHYYITTTPVYYKSPERIHSKSMNYFEFMDSTLLSLKILEERFKNNGYEFNYDYTIKDIPKYIKLEIGSGVVLDYLYDNLDWSMKK